MASVLLCVIYLAFVSLGLPDSLLGAGWPVMYGQLSVPVSYAGVITMLISGGTILSSLFSDRLIRRHGAGRVTAVSVLLTAVALLGFSYSHSFVLLCLWAIPYGLGAGAVDTALNNFVALHYSARHMSWLHCSWGVGAVISPAVMSACLTRGLGWPMGYRAIGVLQLFLTLLIFLSLPLWGGGRCPPSSPAPDEKSNPQLPGDGRCPPSSPAPDEKSNQPLPGDGQGGQCPPSSPVADGETKPQLPGAATSSPLSGATASGALSLRQLLRLPGALAIYLAFFAYCAVETTAGLWAGSYLTLFRSVDPQTAARFTSLFFIGITAGRFIAGFIANRMGDRRMIGLGVWLTLLGVLLVLVPAASPLPALVGLVVIGLGCAPVYPSLIHQTPALFGVSRSQSLLGVQMASSFLGATFGPPLFGALQGWLGIGLYPVYLAVFAALLATGVRLCYNTVSEP